MPESHFSPARAEPALAKERLDTVYEIHLGLAFVFGVADVGACLLQVIHADKNVFSRAIATKKTGSGLVAC